MRLRFAAYVALSFVLAVLTSPAFSDDDISAQEAGEGVVSYRDGRLSVSVRDTSLAELVERIAAQAGFRVVTVGDVDARKGSWSVANRPLAEGIGQLLNGSSSLLVFAADQAGGSELRLQTVYLVGGGVAREDGETDAPPAAAGPGAFNALEPTLANQMLIEETARSSAKDRIAAIDRLAGLTDDFAVANVSFSLKHDPDATVRVHAVHAIANLGGDRAVTVLEPGLGDDASSVRTEVVQALAALSDERVPLWLGQVIVGDPSDDVRLAAVRAIAASPDPVARHFLEAAAADRSAAVRQAATGLLDASEPGP